MWQRRISRVHWINTSLGFRYFGRFALLQHVITSLCIHTVNCDDNVVNVNAVAKHHQTHTLEHVVMCQSTKPHTVTLAKIISTMKIHFVNTFCMNFTIYVCLCAPWPLFFLAVAVCAGNVRAHRRPLRLQIFDIFYK